MSHVITESASSAPAVVPCPRCQKPLIDPKGLGWCQACGYCLSLEDTERKVAAGTKPANPIPTEPPGMEQREWVPRWACVTFVGCVLIAGATYALGHSLKLSPLERALLATMQIGGGVIVMFVGQFIGLLRIAPEDSSLSFKDAVFPFRLYGLILKRLPKSALTVYSGSWGMTAILSAALLIGGVGHWFSYIPKGGAKAQLPQARKDR